MSIGKITKNSVWFCALLKNNGHWPFSIEINRVSYISYNYTSNQREGGATYGGFYDFDSGTILFYIDDPMTDLIREGAAKLKLVKYPGSYDLKAVY